MNGRNRQGRIRREMAAALSVALCLCAASCAADQPAASSATASRVPLGGDITEQLEDLGLNGDIFWSNRTAKEITARNPYDMLGTEETDELFAYDGTMFALPTDPKRWGYGDLYYLTEADRWKTVNGLFPNCIHCYDMESFGGSHFFCGSSIDPDDNARSKGTVYRVDDFGKAQWPSATDLPLIDKNGTAMTYGGSVPRVHELFVFRDTLWALLWDPGSETEGLYRYDAAREAFVYDAAANGKPLLDRLHTHSQDSGMISHCFAFGGAMYFVIDAEGDTLLSTRDLKTYDTVAVSGTVTDVIFRNGAAWVLSTEKSGHGWVNTVWKTTDFAKFEKQFSFRSLSFARSMEECDGSYYFGLGAHATYEFRKNGDGDLRQVLVLTENAEECGRIYRWTP